MPTITRTLAVAIMEKLDFPAASALSTGRLEKKLNRLNKVADVNKVDLGTETLNQTMDIICDAFDAGEHVHVSEDRPEMPDLRTEKTGPAKRQKKSYAESFNTGNTGTKKKSKRANDAKYDWNTIFSGQVVQLEQGTDYTCKSSTMGMQIRNQARKRELKVNVSVQKGAVIAQAIR